MTLVVGQNSYISVNEADQYFQDSLDGSIWSGLTDGQKARLLIEATFNIDSLPFIGFKKDSSQALEFPRIVTRTFISTEPFLSGGITYEEIEINDVIKAAVCEEALSLYKDKTRRELRDSGVDSIRLGDLSETYSKPYPSVSPKAYWLLKKYIVGAVCIR